MAKCWVYAQSNGRASIIRLGPKPQGSPLTGAEWEAYALAKTRFEITRPRISQGQIVDPNEHYNVGNPAHIARANSLPLTAMTDADLPADRSKRDDWIIQGTRVVVAAVPLGPL